MLSVPYAIAPMACAPPTLYILFTPATCAAYNIAGAIFPEVLGGVHNIISLHPAIFAGIANIKTVEKRGAVPPGIYNPTFSIGIAFLQQVTPAIVSTFFSSTCWEE